MKPVLFATLQSPCYFSPAPLNKRSFGESIQVTGDYSVAAFTRLHNVKSSFLPMALFVIQLCCTKMMRNPLLVQPSGVLSATQTKYTVGESVSGCSSGAKHVYCSTRRRKTRKSIHSTTVSCSRSSTNSVSPPGSRTSTCPTCTWTWGPRCCAPASCRSG